MNQLLHRRWLATLGCSLAWATCADLTAAAQHNATLSGVVRDARGQPQMGALVELLTSDATTVNRAFTDERGRYAMLSIRPGKYQIRATAAFLTPASRSNLHLTDGVRTVANLTLTALFETQTWLPTQRRAPDEPVDDWKWTLRAASSRPVLRYADPDARTVEASSSSSAENRTRASSSGSLSVMAGDGAFGGGGAHQILSLDREIEGDDVAVVRANFGDSTPQSGIPVSVDLSGGYEHRSPFGGGTRLAASVQSHPEMVAGGAAQGLQSMRIATAQQFALGDAVLIDAGTLMIAERLASTQIISEPFLRLMVRPAPGLTVQYRFASGRSVQASDDLDRVEPRLDVLSDANGRPLSTRGAHNELLISQSAGRQEVSLLVYQDHVSHATVDGGGGLDPRANAGLAVIDDAATGSFRMAMAGYAGRGISAAVAHHLTKSLTAEVDGDFGTALLMPNGILEIGQVGPALRPVMKPAATASIHGKLPRSGTTVRAQYRWQPARALTQVNQYNTTPEDAYLGFYLRQHIWLGRTIPGRLDAVVEATNLLQQGYRPLLAPDGHTIFLAQVPRTIQGGLSFSF